MPNTVHLHRVLATSPEKIYRAFLEADALAKWLPPNGFACTVHHLEPKVGGTFKMSFRNFTTGKSHEFGGEYVELVLGERLRYTDKFSTIPPARRDAGDCNVEESIGRYRGAYHAGGRAGHHSTRGLLSRLARIAAKPGKARRARDQSIARRDRGNRRRRIAKVNPALRLRRPLLRAACLPIPRRRARTVC